MSIALMAIFLSATHAQAECRPAFYMVPASSSPNVRFTPTREFAECFAKVVPGARLTQSRSTGTSITGSHPEWVLNLGARSVELSTLLEPFTDPRRDPPAAEAEVRARIWNTLDVKLGPGGVLGSRVLRLAARRQWFEAKHFASGISVPALLLAAERGGFKGETIEEKQDRFIRDNSEVWDSAAGSYREMTGNEMALARETRRMEFMIRAAQHIKLVPIALRRKPSPAVRQVALKSSPSAPQSRALASASGGGTSPSERPISQEVDELELKIQAYQDTYRRQFQELSDKYGK